MPGYLHLVRQVLTERHPSAGHETCLIAVGIVKGNERSYSESQSSRGRPLRLL